MARVFLSCCALLGALAAADTCGVQQPTGVSDAIYSCTAGPDIEILTSSEVSICCGEPGPIRVQNFVTKPSMSWAGGENGTLYAVLLVNPDDAIPVAPVLHAMWANVSAEQLSSGQFDEHLVNPYVPPNPLFNEMFIIYQFAYVYMIFKQTQPADVAAWSELPSSRFPIHQFIEDNSLELLATNYFNSSGVIRWFYSTTALGTVLVPVLALCLCCLCAMGCRACCCSGRGSEVSPELEEEAGVSLS